MAHQRTGLALLIAVFVAGCGSEDDTPTVDVEPAPDEHVRVEPEPLFDGPIVPETDQPEEPEQVLQLLH